MLTSEFIGIFREALDFFFAEADEREDEVFDEGVEVRFEEGKSRFRVDAVFEELDQPRVRKGSRRGGK